MPLTLGPLVGSNSSLLGRNVTVNNRSIVEQAHEVQVFVKELELLKYFYLTSLLLDASLQSCPPHGETLPLL